MKLIIFGSTGTLGKHLVKQALDQGHAVTAFSRRPELLDMDHDHLTLAAGDVFDPERVAEAVRGQDAVMCALGAGRKGKVRSTGTANILAAMERHGIRRLACLSTLGVGASLQNLNFFWRYLIFGLLIREAFADHVAQEAVIEQSNLDWIIVRPAAFTDGPPTGLYRHGFGPGEKALKLKISRADVAGFMLRQLADDTYLRRAPGLSY
jgi:putative NADH-flavin reductase